MSFNNSGEIRPPYFNNLSTHTTAIPKLSSAPKQNLGLKSPMIERVHKAKPGCSACGKKVA